MPTWHEFGGLLVESGIPLTAIPELAEHPGRRPAVLVRVVDAPAAPGVTWQHHWLHADKSETLSLSVEGDRYRLRVPGLCDFVLAPKERSVAASPLRKLCPWTLEHLLLDQILPRWFALEGHNLLHAALLEIDGAGVLLVGDSGAGKSTLAAMLQGAGHPVLSDDAVLLAREEGDFLARGTYPSIRLNPDAYLGAMGANSPVLGPVASYNDKVRVEVASLPTHERLPVRVIYQLGANLAPGTSPRVSALTPRAACISLLRQAFAVDLRDPAQMQPILRFHGQLAASVPVFELAYPRQFDAGHALVSRLLAHVRGLARQEAESAA